MSKGVTKRGPGRPPLPEVMPQISIRVHRWMLDELDSMIEDERHGEGDRATLIREAIAKFLGR